MKLSLFSALILMLCAGCANQFSADFKPPAGFFVTSVKAPLTADVRDVTISSGHGQASTLYFHDILLTGMNFAVDSCSITDAAKNGRLKTVTHADYELFTILGIFGKMTIHAYGEPED